MTALGAGADALDWPLTVISEGHSLAEAPRIAPDRSILFSDVIAGGIKRVAADHESVMEVFPRRRGIGGMLLHEDGGLVISGRDLSYVSKEGETSTIFKPEGCEGINDIASDGAGGAYVGSLKFAAISGGEPVPGEVWHLPAGGEPKLIAEHIWWPNGIGLAPDGETLYVSDSHKQLVSAIDLATGDHQAFILVEHGIPDGLAVDERGRVWLALGQRGAVGIFDANGTLVELIDMPTEFVTSVCFGGTENEDVVVTTATKVFHGRAKVAGVRAPLARL
jgi:sugar lactone lactonase YvrE